jgi:2'-5' RNA ligase
MVRGKLEALVTGFKNNKIQGVNWTAIQNIHLTLKFLGELKEDKIPRISNLLSKIGETSHPFNCAVKGVGVFPSIKQPRIVWAGIEPYDDLKNLQEKIETSMTQEGFIREDRPFTPHLTIGRVSDRIRTEDLKKLTVELTRLSVYDMGMTCFDKLHLYKSDLQPGGAVYTVIMASPFCVRN